MQANMQTFTNQDEWLVVLVENEARRVFEFFDAVTALGTGRTRPHVVDLPGLVLGERLFPAAVLVGSPEEWGQADDLREDYPELKERILADRQAYHDPESLFRMLDRLLAAHPHKRVLLLWDDQLNTRWAMEENPNGMTLKFAARFGALLAQRGQKRRVRIVGISAQRDWTTEQKADLARFLREGWIDDFRDRAHVDRLVAELTAGQGGDRVAFFARIAGAGRRGALPREDLAGVRAELEQAARARLQAVVRRLAQEPDKDVAGSWNPAFAGPVVIDETTSTVEIFEHRDRPAWAIEGAWDDPEELTGKRRLATHVLKEITARYLRALREGGEAEVEAFGWRRLAAEDGALAFEGVAYRLLRFLVERGDAVERHEIVRSGLAMSSAVNTYASRIRSGMRRHEILESVTRGGYRCARDVLLVAR